MSRPVTIPGSMSPRAKAVALAASAVVVFAFFPTLAAVLGKPWAGSFPSVALSGLCGIASGCMFVYAVILWRSRPREVTVTITADTTKFVEELRRAQRRMGGER